MDDMPLDCLENILEHIVEAQDLLRCVQVSRRLGEAAASDRLWWLMCGRYKLGGTVDLTDARHELDNTTECADTLGRFVHPGVDPPTRADGEAMGAQGSSIGPASTGQPWLKIFKRATESRKWTVCFDTGRGSARYGRADVSKAKELNMGAYGPGHTELEATQDTLFEAAMWRLCINKADLPSWGVIIAEPFRLVAASAAAAREEWYSHLELNVLPGLELKKICLTDSANLCLLANGLTSGVVVHIGLDAIFVVPVRGGTVVGRAVQESSPGGHALTTYFADLLQQTAPHALVTTSRWPREVVARKVKEHDCEVWPTRLSERLGHNPFDRDRTLARTDAPTARAMVGDTYTALGWERFLPAEALFDNRSNDDGGLQDMVLRAAEQAADEIEQGARGVEADRRRRELREALLTRVVLSGGTAAMSGLGARLKHELERALAQTSNGANTPVVVREPVVVAGGEQTIWSGASTLAGMTNFMDAQDVHTPMEDWLAHQ